MSAYPNYEGMCSPVIFLLCCSLVYKKQTYFAGLYWQHMIASRACMPLKGYNWHYCILNVIFKPCSKVSYSTARFFMFEE